MRDCRIGHELICQCTKSWKSRNSPANKARSTRCAVCSLQSAVCVLLWPLSHAFYLIRSNVRKCLAKHGATFSSLNILRRTNCSGYDEHACNTFFPVMLETEESISEIDSHHLLQEASDLWSCNETGSWQFEVTGALWYGIVWLYNFAV